MDINPVEQTDGDFMETLPAAPACFGISGWESSHPTARLTRASASNAASSIALPWPPSICWCGGLENGHEVVPLSLANAQRYWRATERSMRLLIDIVSRFSD